MKRNISREIAAATKEDSTTLSPNEAHQLLGHHNENRTHGIAKVLGIVLTKGPMEIYVSCVIAMAKQENTTHDTSGHGKSTTYNNKVYSDLPFVY